MVTKLERENARLQQECDALKQARDYQYQQSMKFSRYGERMKAALDAIEKVQYEGYGAGDDWKVIRDLISEAISDGSDILHKQPQPAPKAKLPRMFPDEVFMPDDYTSGDE